MPFEKPARGKAAAETGSAGQRGIRSYRVCSRRNMPSSGSFVVLDQIQRVVITEAAENELTPHPPGEMVKTPGCRCLPITLSLHRFIYEACPRRWISDPLT